MTTVQTFPIFEWREVKPSERGGRVAIVPATPPTRDVSSRQQSRRIVRRKVSDDVVDFLMLELFNGNLRSGDRLDLAAIASWLGISHAPVREAVVLLERDGVLTSEYHRGVFVAPFTPETVLESFELYGVLSGLAASRVARLQDAETISQLKDVLRELRTVSDPGDLYYLHWKFRSVVHHNGASLRVQNLLRNFGGMLRASASLLGPEALHESSAGLRELFQAIRASDPHAAAESGHRMSSRIGWRVIRALEQREVFSGSSGGVWLRDESIERRNLIRVAVSGSRDVELDSELRDRKRHA